MPKRPRTASRNRRSRRSRGAGALVIPLTRSSSGNLGEVPSQAFDSDIVGGKGANLARSDAAGLPVPPAFCIVGDAYTRHLEGLALPPNRIADAICQSDISAQLLAEIFAAYTELSARVSKHVKHGNAVVAVRSSATNEDSSAASFAGQLDTVLGVRGFDLVCGAVKKCWASAHSEQVSAYRASSGLGAGAVAVVVQLMIDSDVSGVMFTANPLTGETSEFVVTSAWGLGEAVVSDLVAPDTFTIEASSGCVVSAEASRKRVMLTLNSDISPGDEFTAMEPVPEHRQKQLSLTATQLCDLHHLASRILVMHAGASQDIEWAFAGGKLYLLQTRPITTLSQAEADISEFNSLIGHDDWLTTCNAQEMFPGAGTPLTISVFGGAIEYGMQQLHVDYGVLQKHDPSAIRLPWVSGHLFINMTNTLYMLTQMVGGEMGKANGEMSILGRINPDLTMEDLIRRHGSPSLPRRLYNSIFYVISIARASQRIFAMEARVAGAADALGLDDEELSVQDMMKRISNYMPEYKQQWSDGIMCGSTSAAWMLLVMKLVCRNPEEMWSTKRVAEISAAFASPNCEASTQAGSEASVASAGALAKLELIKNAIMSHRDATYFATELSAEAALSWLERLPSSHRAATLFRELIRCHGHRCVKEAELRNKDWAEDPLPLVRLLQSSVAAGEINNRPAPVYNRPANSTASEPAQPSVLAQLLATEWSHVSCLRRPLLRYAVRMARRGIQRRELGKSLQIQVHSFVRRAFRRIGSKLAAASVLSDPDLIYFMTLDELEWFCQNFDQDTTLRRVSGICITAAKRRRLLPQQEALRFADLMQGIPKPLNNDDSAAAVRDHGQGFEVVGTPVSRGIGEGVARVVRTLGEAEALQAGEILICPFTDVGWTPYFSLAGALVTEIGGLLSHGAVVAREYGLPCVVNVSGACQTFHTGMRVRVDGETGTVSILQTNSNLN